MAELDFRVLPETDDLTARQKFEAYPMGLQGSKISIGMSAASGMMAGSAAGPLGIVVGGALGALAGYWNRKTYRQQVYAQFDAAGVLEKPRIRYRSTFDIANRDFVFIRYPYAELTALVIVPLLQKYYPTMTVPELTAIGQESQRALIRFRKAHDDMPISLAAETILAYFGVVRNAAGEYDLVSPGDVYTPPPKGTIPYIPQPHTAHHIPPLPPDIFDKEPNYWLYVGIGIGAVFILTR